MKLHRLALGTLFFLLVNAPYAAEPHDTSCSAAAQPAQAAMVK